VRASAAAILEHALKPHWFAKALAAMCGEFASNAFPLRRDPQLAEFSEMFFAA